VLCWPGAGEACRHPQGAAHQEGPVHPGTRGLHRQPARPCHGNVTTHSTEPLEQC